MKLEVTKIPPRTVIVANHEKVSVNGIVTFDMKLDGLPSERVTAYTFPLGNVDLILGLPWLKKHKPNIDWDRDAYEFARSGRRYMLYPKEEAPKIKIVSDPALRDPTVAKSRQHANMNLSETPNEILLATAEEFDSFVDDHTHLFLINTKILSEEGRELRKAKTKSLPPEDAENSQRLPRKIRRWMKRHCPELLREIGRPAKLEPFNVDTGDHAPIKINPRPYSPVDLAKIKEFIDENLKSGVISESDSPWSFPLVLAVKPDGGTRVCVDYRALNRITRKDAHPLPRIDESLLRFYGMRYFTHIDLRSGYWQIILDLVSRQKTAFSSRYGHYEFNVIPFGLSNAPGAFQRRMNKVLRKYFDKFCIVYLDDILIYSKTKKEHFRHVKKVLKALNSADMILNLAKCTFFARQVKFLGHIIDENGSRPDPRNIEKILSWPTPQNITEVRGFCNLVNVYRKYIRRLAKRMAPLTDLMKGSPARGSAIKWGREEDKAFRDLKTAVTSEPVLKHPRIGDDFYVDPDASQLAIGAALLQYFLDPDGKKRLHPIAFESKKLTETEQRYTTQERELLAAKYALDHWRYIIEGSPIFIRSDHESLKTYRTKNPMTKRLVRFINDIEHFDPKFIYRPGHLQKVPDSLSRMPGLKEEGDPADTSHLFEVEQSESIFEFAKVVVPQKIKFYVKLHDSLKRNTASGDLAMYELGKDGKLWNRQLRTPVIFSTEDLRKIVQLVHKDLGHYGKRVTFHSTKQRYEIATDLSWVEGEKVLNSCIPCQLYRPSPRDYPRIHPYGTKRAFEMWEIDFVGPFRISKHGNRYLITAIDYCTGKAFAYPLPQRSHEAAIELLEDIIWTYGKPAQVVHDNGEEFKCKEFQAVCKRYGIRSRPTTPGHPQTNGKVERLNYELVQRLQRISAEEGHDLTDWDIYIRQALFAFHAHPHSRLGVTPFYLQHGIEPVLPSTSVVSKPITRVEIAEAIERRQKHVQDLSKYRSEIQDRYRRAMERLARNREEYSSKEGIQNGDLVMRHVLNVKSKLDHKWDGPFVAVASTDKDAYQLSCPNGYVLRNLVNQARLRKLTSSEIEKYVGEFWSASERLKLHERRVKEEQELRDLEKKVAQATIDALEAQKKGKPTSLEQHAELAARRKEIKALQAQRTADPSGSTIRNSSNSRSQPVASPTVTAPPLRRSLRHPRPVVRYED